MAHLHGVLTSKVFYFPLRTRQHIQLQIKVFYFSLRTRQHVQLQIHLFLWQDTGVSRSEIFLCLPQFTVHSSTNWLNCSYLLCLMAHSFTVLAVKSTWLAKAIFSSLFRLRYPRNTAVCGLSLAWGLAVLYLNSRRVMTGRRRPDGRGTRSFPVWGSTNWGFARRMVTTSSRDCSRASSRSVMILCG